MKHRARISRLRRLLMSKHVEYPPFIVNLTDDAGEITDTIVINMRF